MTILGFLIMLLLIYIVVQWGGQKIWYKTFKLSMRKGIYCKNCVYRLPLKHSWYKDEDDFYRCKPFSTKDRVSSFSNDCEYEDRTELDEAHCRVMNEYGMCPWYKEIEK